MPDFPVLSGGGFAEGSGAAAVAVGSASANTKGSWTEIVAATAFDADQLIIGMAQAGNSLTHLVDIALGGSGSEEIIIPNILHGGHSRMMTWIPVPVSVPEGTRIAARVQSTSGSAQVQIRVVLIRQGFFGSPPGGRIITLGAQTADSGGTQVDPGAVGNTYGAWSELTASTSDDIWAILPRLGNIGNGTAADSAANFYYDIGVGASSAEVPISSFFAFSTAANGSFGGGGPAIWLPASIPAGSRISARARANVTDATDRLFDVTILALT